MTAEQWRALRTVQRRKYGNRPTTTAVGHFDSKAEADRHADLELLQRAGAIRDLRRQVTFPLVVNGVKIGNVRPDWTYTEGDGSKVAEDHKGGGLQTPVHRLRWKLAKVLYPEWRWVISK